MPVFNNVTAVSSTVGRFNKFELIIHLTAGFSNPYNYDDIALQCEFVSPSGKKDTVDGFYMDNYSLNTSTGALSATGTGNFAIRFAPVETGTWHYTLFCQNTSGITVLPVQSFECVTSPAKGFIRKNTTNYLNFDNGDQYFAIGENLCWQSSNVYTDYKSWTQKLADNKANYFRLWLTDWGLGIEWKNDENGFSGLERYKQTSSFYIDWLLDECATKNIYMMFCINHHGQVSTTTNPEWVSNPYNAANGGPCANTWDFFSNSAAKNLHKNRLRYIIARWGYSQNILSWELFNEVEWTDNFSANKAAIKDWHEEMAAYLKKKDVNKHLVTTSYANDANDPDTWNIPEIDFTQTHYYNGSPNIETVLSSGIQSYLSQFSKPTLNGEFGLVPNTSSLAAIDPDGVYIHNSLWASAFSGAMGAAMSWWWDTYIDPQNLYTHFKPLGTFISSINLKNDNYKRVATTVSGGGNADLSISPGADWGKSPASAFTVNPDGSLSPNSSQLSRYLYGSIYNTSFRNPPTFTITYPVSGQFKIITGGSSGTNPKIDIYVDGILQLEQVASANSTYSVTINSGTHTIKVDNSGTDWILISQFVFSNISSPLNTYFLKSFDNTKACGWIHNKQYNWQYLKNNAVAPPAVTGAAITIPGMQEGSYMVQFIDCSTGIVSSSTVASAVAGNLVISVPTVSWDLAINVVFGGATPVTDIPLSQPMKIYPNPVTEGKLYVVYDLSNSTQVNIEVFDSRGIKLATIFNGRQTAGSKKVEWDIKKSGIPAGNYFIRFTDGKIIGSTKIIIRL